MRELENFTVSDIQTNDDTIVLISTGGCIFHRAAGDFTRTPQLGEELLLESIGCRVTGLFDPANGVWLFRWTDEELAEQDAAVTTQ